MSFGKALCPAVKSQTTQLPGVKWLTPCSCLHPCLGRLTMCWRLVDAQTCLMPQTTVCLTWITFVQNILLTNQRPLYGVRQILQYISIKTKLQTWLYQHKQRQLSWGEEKFKKNGVLCHEGVCRHWHGDAVVMRKLAGCCRGNGTTWRACWCLLGDAARSLSSLAVGQWKTPAYHNFDWLLALQQFPLPASHLPVHNKMSTDRLNDFLDFVIRWQLCSVGLLLYLIFQRRIR